MSPVPRELTVHQAHLELMESQAPMEHPEPLALMESQAPMERPEHPAD